MNRPQPKVISDVCIHDAGSGSWMCLLGMPLIEEHSPEARQRLLRDLLRDPRDVLRTRIDGHFVLFAFDAARDRLIASNDINSCIPVFYARTKDGVLFSSTELVLARVLNRSLDATGVAQSIIFHSTWGSTSRFAGVCKMLPGEVVTVEKGNVTHNELYWAPGEEATWSGSFDAVVEAWMDRLKTSFLNYRRHAPHVDVSADLTGGEDSRLVVAQLHQLDYPYTLRVRGLPTDVDVQCATRYARALHLPLTTQSLSPQVDTQLVHQALDVSWANDGYGSWFYMADRQEQLLVDPPWEHSTLHFSGVPGGAVHRGAYYLKAGLPFPSREGRLDPELLIRFKFALDVVPGLLRMGDDGVRDLLVGSIRSSLDEVDHLPLGTQVDHVVRSYQESKIGTMAFPKRYPFYWPLGSREMIKAIYNTPPRYKKGSQVTRAATEAMFPELARMKTDENVPTLRRSITRWPLFVPGYYAIGKRICLGAMRRKLRYRQHSSTLARRHRIDRHAPMMRALLRDSDYGAWFRSASSMATGDVYNGAVLDEMLANAKDGKCAHVEILGRIVNLELAVRFVSGDVPDAWTPRTHVEVNEDVSD